MAAVTPNAARAHLWQSRSEIKLARASLPTASFRLAQRHPPARVECRQAACRSVLVVVARDVRVPVRE